MATVYYTLTEEEIHQFTPEEKAELAALENRPIVIDEDCPEVTPEMIRKAYRPGEDRPGDMMSVRVQVLVPTLDKAKTFGKNYIARLGELLDEAVSNYRAE